MEALAVILTILKVLGIIIGAILCLAILVILVLRFGYIHYKAFVTIHDGVPEIRVRLSILYPFLFIYVNFIKGKLLYDARIFRLSYFYDDVDKMTKRKKKDKVKNYRLSEKEHSLIDDLLDLLAEEEEPEAVKQARTEETNAKEKKEKRSFFSSLKLLVWNGPEIMATFWEKMKVIFGYLKDVRMLFSDAKNREAIIFVWNTIKAIIAYIFVKRHVIKLDYGDEEYDVTAERYGVICSVAALFGANLKTQLYPGENVLELDARFNDYVKIYTVLLWVLDLYKNDKLVDVITKLS